MGNSSVQLDWVHVPTPGDHYSPRTGSATITVIREINKQHLLASGHTRVLVARGTWNGFDDQARVEVDFSRLGTPLRWHKLVDRILGHFIGTRIFSSWPYRVVAARLGPDFTGTIFIHNEPAAIELIAKRCPKSKVCLWVHNELFKSYSKTQARRVVKNCFRVICVSDYINRNIRDFVGEDSRIVTVHNAVDTNTFVPSQHKVATSIPVIVFVGRMVPEKGADLLLEACMRLNKLGVAFNLRIVGSANFNAADALTDYQKQLVDLSRAVGKNVEFVPFKPPTEIVQEYQGASIACIPSNWDEPFGLTVLESMATGLPTIATRIGGIPEAGGDAILYFERGDVTGLTERLIELLSSEELRISWGRKARERAIGFDYRCQYQKLRRTLGS